MLSTVTFVLGVKFSHVGPVSAFATDFKAHLTTGNLKVINGSAYLAVAGGVWQQDRAYVNLADSDSLTALLARGQDPRLSEALLGEAKALAGKSQGKFSTSPLGFQMYMEISAAAPVKARAGGKTADAHKDPNAPKRPLNAYMLYSAEQRASLKEERPDLSHKDIMKALGEEWKALSDADKEKYVKMQEAQKAKYKVALETYNKGAAPATEAPADLVSFD